MIDDRADAVVFELCRYAQVPETIGVERVVENRLAAGDQGEHCDEQPEAGRWWGAICHVHIVGNLQLMG